MTTCVLTLSLLFYIALHFISMGLDGHSDSVRSALTGSLYALMSDQPGMYRRDGYVSRVDNMIVDVLCGMILAYSGIVRSDDDIRTAVEKWCTNRTNAIERYGHISYWDTSAVTNMAELFQNKGDFDDDISKWDVSNVTNMYRMFAYATSFNQPIGAWDTHNVTNMYGMFDDGCPLKQSPPHWYH